MSKNLFKNTHYNTLGHVMLLNTRRGTHELTFSVNRKQNVRVCEVFFNEPQANSNEGLIPNRFNMPVAMVNAQA
jgi:hypothetical protein